MLESKIVRPVTIQTTMPASGELSVEDLSPDNQREDGAAGRSQPSKLTTEGSKESVKYEESKESLKLPGGGSKEAVHAQSSRVGISPQGSRLSRPQTARSSSSSYEQFGARGGRFSGARPKSDVEWAMYKAKQTPGPGEYKPDSAYKVGGGKFNLSKPKSDLDWAMLTAKNQPGPGDYRIDAHEKMNGGRFSTSRPKSALEWTVYQARNSPGPGQYEPEQTVRLKGGKFSSSRPKSDVDWHMYHSKQSPGPGQYGINRDLHCPGGKFNLSKPKTDVDWSILRARQSPGPLDYDVDTSYRISGGRFSSSRPKSALEWAMHKGSQQPGPGEYNIQRDAIARRTGAVESQPSIPSLPKDLRPRSASVIPPEARRRPKPKPDFTKQEEERRQKRPSTSMGIPPEARRKPKPRATSAPPGPRPGVPGKAASPAISSSSQVTVQVNGGETKAGGKGASQVGCEAAKVRESGGRKRPQTASNLYSQASRRDPSLAPPPRPSSSFLGHSPSATRTRSISVQASEEELGEAGVAGPLRPQTAHSRASTLPSSSRPSYLQRRPPPVTTAPVRSSKRIPKAKRSGSAKCGGSAGSSMAETRSQLSDNARRLFDLAMQSTEFKKMMELYTGVKDPSSIIEKYAMMWSYQPLLNETRRR